MGTKISSHFCYLAILQSLSPDDMQTGRRLCEDAEALSAFHQRDLDVRYFDVPTRAAFAAALEEIRVEAQKGNWPLLHIDCHGAEAGIQLGDGTFMVWPELKQSFTLINVATRLNLLIVLAACHGGYLGSTISLTDRAPCWGMIGPTHEVTQGEIQSSFGRFYSELLTSLSGDDSLSALMRVELTQGGFFFTTAPQFFRLGFANYLVNYNTPSALDERADQLAQRAREQGNPIGRDELRARLAAWESHLLKYRERFFMTDLFPENEMRFPNIADELRIMVDDLQQTSTYSAQG